MSAPVCTQQALGLLEASAHNYKAARRWFQAATTADSSHGPSWVAWALMEGRRGHQQQALALFKRGNSAAPGHVPLLSAWARLEVRVALVGGAALLDVLDVSLAERHVAGWNGTIMHRMQYPLLFAFTSPRVIAPAITPPP